MAKIIPAKPRGKPGKAFLAFHRILRSLPDDYTAWLSLGESQTSRPHVFLVWRDRHAFLIQIAATTQSLAESALQPDFFNTGESLQPDELGSDECSLMESFVTRASDSLGPLGGSIPLTRLVVFPDVTAGTIDEILMHRTGESETRYLGLHQLPASRFEHQLSALAAAAMPEPALASLRRAFTPESVVPPSFTARTPPARDSATPLPPAFLDLDQEWCVKNDLDLLPEHQPLVEAPASSVRLVTGVAGCGKSLVLLYRALLTARLHPQARVLVLTHNKPLRHELERRSQALEVLPDNLHCTTFFQWATRHIGRWDQTPWWPAKIETVLAELKQGHPSIRHLSNAFLAIEIGWIKDNGILRQTAYLGADRGGRGTALQAVQRTAIWKLFRDYQKRLERENATDWHNIALRFHQAATTGKCPDFPCYDAIFIDEAQFFAKAWFEAVNAALKPGGHLFLAADPTQGFLRRRQSWLSAGINVRGRTTRLHRPYRNTRAILRHAREFYEKRRTSDDANDELNIPDDTQLAAIPDEGEAPAEFRVPTPQDEIARAARHAAELREAGHPPGRLLILHAHSPHEKQLRAALQNTLGPQLVHDAKAGPAPPAAFCSVTTLNAATGLESPVVILLGIDSLLESENDPRLTPDERDELRRDHTRLIYMGITRAGSRLILIRSGVTP